MSMHSFLDGPINTDFLDKKKVKQQLKDRKKRRQQLHDDLDQYNRRMVLTRESHGSPEAINSEIDLLKKGKKKIKKKLEKNKKKSKKIKRELKGFDQRFSVSSQIQQIVNVDGLFRTEDIRYVTNGYLDISIHAVGKMLNFRTPNYRKITDLVENIIGNLSLCYVDDRVVDYKMIEILTNYILRHKPILDLIDPFAVVLLNKFLMLSRLSGSSIVYDCDNIARTNKFSNCYCRYIEGKYAFDQFIDFAKFQQKFMTSEQMIIFSQYQRIIRVLEDGDYIDCKSNKVKQRFRNGLRDIGIRRQQVGQLAHYAYDRTMDAAREYYSGKDKRFDPLFEHLRAISQFTPDYAGEAYAMSRF